MDRTGNGLAIVAIPSADDYVWNISSEKVPHLTLLYLGDQAGNPNLAHMAEYLKHVADTSLCRFGLDVERRGELGPKQADVLFFNKRYEVDHLVEVRSFLLADSHINAAYQSAAQYPGWVPHLTLGYPESPAKPDERDYPGIHWVNFDRVALWTSDYDGPEFLLDSDDHYRELAMSTSGMSLDEVLEHYGIRGMRWGVRRTDKQIARAKAAGSGDHKRAKAIDEKAKRQGVHTLTNKQLKAAADRHAAETKYKQARSSNSRFTKGHNAAKAVLAVGGTLSAAYALATSPAARAGISAITRIVARG